MKRVIPMGKFIGFEKGSLRNVGEGKKDKTPLHKKEIAVERQEAFSSLGHHFVGHNITLPRKCTHNTLPSLFLPLFFIHPSIHK
jgi:hypothetical protein